MIEDKTDQSLGGKTQQQDQNTNKAMDFVTLAKQPFSFPRFNKEQHGTIKTATKSSPGSTKQSVEDIGKRKLTPITPTQLSNPQLTSTPLQKPPKKRLKVHEDLLKHNNSDQLESSINIVEDLIEELTTEQQTKAENQPSVFIEYTPVIPEGQTSPTQIQMKFASSSLQGAKIITTKYTVDDKKIVAALENILKESCKK